jgi:GH25 family lysozyme M1 (1,4-beta-N-acetylmuramidase)
VTGLRGRASIAGGALIIMAGLAIPAATSDTATAATTSQILGTDVSNFTTVTSWPAVKAAGMTFVGVAAIQGKSSPNTNYNSQVTGAASAGLYVMPYVYADPGKWSASAQFGYGWNVINGIPGTPYVLGGQMLPIALDMESDPINFPGQPCYGLSQTAMKNWIRQFIQADVNKTGAAPIIYSNPTWWASCIGSTNPFGAYPLWIADYGVSIPTIPSGWNNDAFWQSSNKATISGIEGTGEADLDYLGPAVQASQVGKAIAAVQLRTFSSLQGQTVSYQSATGLPPNLAMSSSGRITGTPTTIGQYAVTVAPSAGAVPSTLTFTWDVHGTITVASPGNRISTAGSPVAFRVATSGPDQNAGFAPSLRAAGLPAGASMSSSGLITGWPSKPGTFRVAVSASDGLGGTGSVSFAWTIRAAGDTGFTGTIRQAGGTGKCLDDPGAKTASGTDVDLSSCTGRANQNWTVVPDGTIRVLGKCLDVAGESRSNGARLQLWTCASGDGGQQWQAGTDGELVNPQSGKCLDVAVSSAANGTRPVLWTCANLATQPNEHWLRPAASVYSGDPGKCLAVSGSAVVLAGCANTAAQHWTAQSDGSVRLASKCLTETAATAGSALSIGSCSGAAATKWTLTGAGPIATELAGAAPGLCVTTPSNAAGARLVIEPCAATPAATWHVE